MISDAEWFRARLHHSRPDIRLGRLLGRGAFGVVFEGVDELDRSVAVKMVDPSAISGGAHAGQEALREARLLASVDHPHIVRVYRTFEASMAFQPVAEFERPALGAGPVPAPAPAPAVGYERANPLPVISIVMELLPGGSLLDRIMRGVPRPEWSCAVVLAVAGALAAAHDRKVLHRDVKPTNILFTGDGQPKLTDFGIARALEDSGVNTLRPAGTPRYMAPEQFGLEPLYPTADIYALGLVAYELLTGRMVYPERPTEQENAQARHAGLLPEDVIRVLWKALAREPRDRHQNAREFAFDLAAAAAAAWGPGWLARAGFQAFLDTDVQTAALGLAAGQPEYQPRPAIPRPAVPRHDVPDHDAPPVSHGPDTHVPSVRPPAEKQALVEVRTPAEARKSVAEAPKSVAAGTTVEPSGTVTPVDLVTLAGPAIEPAQVDDLAPRPDPAAVDVAGHVTGRPAPPGSARTAASAAEAEAASTSASASAAEAASDTDSGSVGPAARPAANDGERPAGGLAAGDGPLVAGLLDGADPWAGARGGLLVLGLVSLIAAVVLVAVIVFR